MNRTSDYASPAFKADAHAFYARARAETPVLETDLPGGERGILVMRYDDVSILLKDARLVKDFANAHVEGQRPPRQPPRLLSPLTRNMLALDDPDHARLKRLVQAAFTPRRVETLVERTRQTAGRLLDQAARRKQFDLIADFALPLPVAVISDLLGVHERDRERFARWSHAIIRIPESRLGGLLALPQMLALMHYLRRLVASKRAAGGDDLVSDLVQAERVSQSLDENELLAMIAILLSAGHETTTNLIGNGMLALLQNEGELARLRATPSLIDTAIEELLRFDGPAETSTVRYAREDIEIAGVPIRRGAHVYGVIASANRDERRFVDGHRLDLGRQANRHLTFGEGGHYCVGAALARMEGRVAFPMLLDRFPNLRRAAPLRRIRWRPGLVLRGLYSLPVIHS